MRQGGDRRHQGPDRFLDRTLQRQRGSTKIYYDSAGKETNPAGKW
jgi:hypothetical protein